jgi:hypothetical protein
MMSFIFRLGGSADRMPATVVIWWHCVVTPQDDWCGEADRGPASKQVLRYRHLGLDAR